jgi:hypothetical protein
MWEAQLEIRLRPWVEYGVYCADFHETPGHWVKFCAQLLYTEFYTNRTRNVEKQDKILFTALRKLCLSRRRLPWNVQFVNSITWIAPVTEVMTVGQETSSPRTEINWRPSVKCHCVTIFTKIALSRQLSGTYIPNFMKIRQTVRSQSASFHENRPLWTTVYQELVCRISRKSDRRFTR